MIEAGSLAQCRRPKLRATLCCVALLVLSAPVAASQTFIDFDDFSRRLEASNPESRQELSDSFVRWQQEHGGFPIVKHDGSVVFFFRGSGKEQDVRITGDFRPSSFFSVTWDSIGSPMTRIGQVFYGRLKFQPDARFDYKFVVDGHSAVDALNPRRVISGPGGGEVSELVMARHRLLTEILVRPGIPRGTLNVVQEPWATPKVTIYLPPGYSPSNRYPTLYTTDGSAWIELVQLPTILDNLISNGEIEPIIAVMIDATGDRRSWYYYNPEYLTYVRRVSDYVDSHYSTRRNADQRAHVGTSAGGRAALYAGLELPKLFEKIGMLSPSLDAPAYYYEPYFSESRRPNRNLRVWLSAGTYEGSIYRDAHTIEAYFKKVGVKTRAVYVHQGHSFGAWRELTPDMLKYFFFRIRDNRRPIGIYQSRLTNVAADKHFSDAASPQWW
jgi:enterochelin esterase-like enzyme